VQQTCFAHLTVTDDGYVLGNYGHICVYVCVFPGIPVRRRRRRLFLYDNFYYYFYRVPFKLWRYRSFLLHNIVVVVVYIAIPVFVLLLLSRFNKSLIAFLLSQ
jgi:hypothetical protein